MPHKNLKQLAGKPMIAYSIECALNTGLFDKVYICTEDEEIAATAVSFGATVPELVPTELCGDLVHGACHGRGRANASVLGPGHIGGEQFGGPPHRESRQVVIHGW